MIKRMMRPVHFLSLALFLNSTPVNSDSGTYLTPQNPHEQLEITEATIGDGLLVMRWNPGVTFNREIKGSYKVDCSNGVGYLEERLVDDGEHSIVVETLFSAIGIDHSTHCNLIITLVRAIPRGGRVSSSEMRNDFKRVTIPLYPN